MSEDRRRRTQDGDPRTENRGRRAAEGPADVWCSGRCDGCRRECPFRAGAQPALPAGNGRFTLHASRGTRPERRETSDERRHSPRCCNACVYAGRVRGDGPPELICVNHPDAPGEMTRVRPGGQCRHFRAKRQQGRRRASEPEPPDDEVRYLALTKNRFAIVDAADYAALSKHKWTACFNGDKNKCYVTRRQDGKTICMHREIMQTPAGLVTDHINANPCNNCRHNLRNCTQRQNVWNGRGRHASSGFKGVWYDKALKRYQAGITIDGEKLSLGWFDDPVEAARVRDRKARELYGPYAWLNFPPEDSEPAAAPPHESSAAENAQGHRASRTEDRGRRTATTQIANRKSSIAHSGGPARPTHPPSHAPTLPRSHASSRFTLHEPRFTKHEPSTTEDAKEGRGKSILGRQTNRKWKIVNRKSKGLRDTASGLRPRAKHILARRRKERQEEALMYSLFAILASWRDAPSIRDTRNEIRTMRTGKQLTHAEPLRRRGPTINPAPWAPAALLHAAAGRTVLCPRSSVLRLAGAPPPRGGDK